jgi:hypothetical protein
MKSMKRRDFFKGAVYSSLAASIPAPNLLAQETNNHPHVIQVVPDGLSLSIPLQTALQEAYDV